MTTRIARAPISPPRLDPRPALRRAWVTDRLLTAVGLAMILALAGTLAALVADPRQIAGAPAWLKPAKFAISISVYSFTFLWLLGFVAGHPRLLRLATVATATGFVAEIVIIAGQAARGTTSHFNDRTPLDAALYSAMGGFIMVVWAMNALAAVLLLRQRLPDPAQAAALRLGLFLTLVGAGVGFLMAKGNAHSAGAADGGSGLPVVGWSTAGGDLRIGHFVGLHGMQIMPLLGWLISRRMGRFSPRRRAALVRVAGFGYLGLVVILVWQALRGQSIVAPDAATLAALGALAAGVAAATTIIFATEIHRQPRR